MNRLTAVRVAALFSSGIMAGLLFGDWLGPAFARSAMSVSSFIEFQQIVHVNYLLTLPALSTLALGTSVLWVIMLRDQRGTTEFRLVLTAAITIAIGFTITLVFNVPVNNELETWKAAAPPENARAIWSRWEKAHVVRTIFWTLGFFLETVALGVSASRNTPTAAH